MTMTWILIANASEAHLYSSPKAKLYQDNSALEVLADYRHPESRRKDASLVTDKRGCRAGYDASMGATVSEHTAKQVEAETFARELVDKLAHGHDSDRFQELIVAAPPQFHGLLRKYLQQKHISNLVCLDIQKDYTKCQGNQLLQQLQAHL